jgi:putative iron-dependent peroxidase
MAEQTAILPGVPRAGRYLSFSIRQGVEASECVAAIETLAVDDWLVLGIGAPLVAHCSTSIEGLRTFPALSGPGIEVPSTQHALWCWLRGEDHGELVNRSNAITDALASGFVLQKCVDAFRHGDGDLGQDLTGYEDGTENPTGGDAVNAAIVNGRGDGLDGSSFVAVQQWVHDLRAFSRFPEEQQDLIIGRRKSDNEEIENAPASAHTKRTEQESFTPEAFVVRRSMPWAGQSGEGLMFVAFGNTLDAFEVQLRRMAGLEDGIPDALFRFSRAVTGGYYWCPPVRDGRLYIGALTES